jgi:hypothetical protein
VKVIYLSGRTATNQLTRLYNQLQPGVAALEPLATLLANLQQTLDTTLQNVENEVGNLGTVRMGLETLLASLEMVDLSGVGDLGAAVNDLNDLKMYFDLLKVYFDQLKVDLTAQLGDLEGFVGDLGDVKMDLITEIGNLQDEIQNLVDARGDLDAGKSTQYSRCFYEYKHV